MYSARLVCSDPGCANELAVEVATLRELETLMCDCGCALAVIGWPEVAAEPLARVILLRAATARRRRRMPEAA